MLTDPNYSAGAANSSNGWSSQGFDIDSIFSRFGFGGFGGFGGATKNKRTVKRQQAVVSISFKESCFGTTKGVTFSFDESCKPCKGKGAANGDFSNCQACGGSGRRVVRLNNIMTIETENVCQLCAGKGVLINKACGTCSGNGFTKKTQTKDVNLPPLLEDNVILQLNIDEENILNLIVRVQPDPLMRREGLDIISTTNISLKDALLGGNITVPTLHGDKTVSIKECTTHGTKLRLKNCGAKHPQKEEFGNHTLIINVEFPKELTEDQKKKIEEVFK